MKMAAGILFVMVLSILLAEPVTVNQNSGLLYSRQISDFSCDKNGYIEYLNSWTVEDKLSSRDPNTKEFKERLEYFIDNCVKIHEWNRKDKYKLEFTYYADWSLEEFEKLGSTTQRYTGMKPDIIDFVPLMYFSC